MGLDQYAYTKSQDKDAEPAFVWRKHAKLQTFMENLWTVKTGHGLIKVEKVPGVGNFTDHECDYGDASVIAVHDGDLWLAGSFGRILRRRNEGDWEIINQQEPSERSKIMLSGLAFDVNGTPIGVGDIYDGSVSQGIILVRAAASELQGQPLDDVALFRSKIWVCGRGRVLRADQKGQFSSLPIPPEATTLSKFGVQGNKMYIAGEGKRLWEITDEGLLSVEPFGDRGLAISGFDTTPAGLVAQGENGFATFDGETWTRISVAW